MTDNISLVMFAVPIAIAIIFTVLAILPKGENKNGALFSVGVITFFSCLVGAIGWFISGLTWPALATTEMLSSIAYLWYGLGVILSIMTVYIGLRMLGEIFETKDQPRLRLVYDDED